MASHSSSPPQEPCALPPNWLELPDDVTASILGRLDDVEILTSAQHVCSTWRRICRDPSMWRSIDISYRDERWFISYRGLDLGERDHITELCRRAVEWSSGGLLDVNMEYAPYDLLPYIANRSNHLRRLRLVYCTYISDEELIEVAEKTPFLEELELSYCHFSSEVVDAFGQQCPRLHTFKLNHRGCTLFQELDDEAFAIAENMSGLHHLQIFGNKLSNDGLDAILDECRQLESLDMRQCFHLDFDVDSERRCKQIKLFRGPLDSTDDYPFDSKVRDELCIGGLEGSEDDDDDCVKSKPSDIFKLPVEVKLKDVKANRTMRKYDL